MKVITGTVIDGRVELPAKAIAEGAHVMVLAPESGEPIRLSSDEERELLEAMEQIRHGNYMEAQDLLAELRSRPGG